MLSATSILLALVTGLLAGCAAGPSPVSTSQRDPSNPAAPEGARVAVAPAAPPPASPHAEHAGHAGHESGDAEAAGYVCPMHPEVTSTAPGVCPKCNMKLVPKS